jgi:hypothetical protein
VLTLKGSRVHEIVRQLTWKKDGLTHAFVVYFDSIADRDYYVRDDPAHRAFVETLEGVTKKPREAVVMDFEPGKF